MLFRSVGLPMVYRLFSSNIIMRIMYVLIFISFSLTTILVTLIWLRARQGLFFAYHICGYKKSSELIEILKRYYCVSGFGFVVGCISVIIISGMMSEVAIEFGDIIQAFAMTVGIGTLILLVCYFLNKKGR